MLGAEFTADVEPLGQDPRHGPLPLLLIVLTVVSGLVDAVSYFKLGHVFVANMTGNVLFLGFATADAAEFSIAVSLVAMGSFLLGALAGGRLGSSTGQHRGRFLAFAMGLQNATARRLGVPDLTTSVLTQTVTGLAADPQFAGGTNPNIGRRLLAIAAMFVGAALGSVLIFRVSVSAALAVAVVLLLVNTMAMHRLSSSTAAWTAAK